ncbi:MAG: group 1 glycosyl transferase [Mucilaginibacter sp.]|nr:group 1 glycosyl transferase [Mucilaginibacter sp.]
MKPVKFILIGNYPPDKQESMKRFAGMINSGLIDAGFETELWCPVQFFNVRAKHPHKGLGKWLGYIDKWLLFPIILKSRLFLNKSYKKGNVVFLVCDHSNSFYLNFLPIKYTIITCHDVLAIRGALGYADAYNPASATGKILQKWIFKNLIKAHYLIAVSKFTLKQLTALNPTSEKNDWKVIYNGFNAEFKLIDQEKAKLLIKDAGLISDIPFILHVGSHLPRKNRKLLIDMVCNLGNEWNGVICYAGQRLDKELLDYAISLSLETRIVNVIKPNHETLVALYNMCEAFIFPSFSEGFGWPLIEAQACGAPVIASNIEPMPEISNLSALHADPHDPETFSKEFLKLKNDTFKAELIEKGFKNCARFKTEIMIDKYLEYIEAIINKPAI